MQDCMLDRNWYSNLREINPVSRGDYLQTENIVNSIAGQNHKNDLLHEEYKSNIRSTESL